MLSRVKRNASPTREEVVDRNATLLKDLANRRACPLVIATHARGLREAARSKPISNHLARALIGRLRLGIPRCDGGRFDRARYAAGELLGPRKVVLLNVVAGQLRAIPTIKADSSPCCPRTTMPRRHSMLGEAQRQSLSRRTNLVNRQAKPQKLVQLTTRCLSVSAVASDDRVFAHAQGVLGHHDADRLTLVVTVGVIHHVAFHQTDKGRAISH